MIRNLVSLFAAATLVAGCFDRNEQSTSEDVDDSLASSSVAATKDTASDYCQFPSAAPAAGSDQTAFDTYSWTMFLSLNWVVSENQRGVPDCTKPLATPGSRVWESWKTLDQVFLPGAANPGTWDSSWGSDEQTSMAATSKLSPEVARNLQMMPTESTVLQPVGGWLIDQRGNPTYYQIASNEVSYNYIVSNQLYNADVASSFHPVDFPFQSAEIKASWRILGTQDDQNRYLVTTAEVEQFDAQGNPTGVFVEKTLGLVGLHIINKAPNFPQWVWATFEQIDNVSPSAPFAPYYDASATNPNQSPCFQHAVPCRPKEGKTFQTPDPLTRMTPIVASTAGVNATFQAMFKDSFVKYYELVTTQRPQNPNDPGDPLGTPTPNISANTTMESYIQPTSSCMACHQTASPIGSPYKSDFSFLLLHAQKPSTEPH